MERQKQQKLEGIPDGTTANIDMISSLPDSLLCHILSLLPTTTSVATCILSRRWRYLWEDLQVFDFSVHGRASVNFVNKVLTLRRVCHIQKFSLLCDYYPGDENNDHAATWVRAATGPHLQELRISIPILFERVINQSGFKLPQSIFTCTKLVSLFLGGGIDLDILSPVHLPSLKNLEVNICCLFPDAIEELVSGCPALETLKLNFDALGPLSMRVPPSLKTLVIGDKSCFDVHSLEINAPSLEYLDINLKPLYYRLSISNLHNVVEAHVNIYVDYHVEFLLELLSNLCKTTKLLELKLNTTECLLHAKELSWVVDFPEFGYENFDFPKFGCLRHLHLDIPYFDLGFLMNILHSCHMLRVLIIINVKGICKQYRKPLNWTHPTSIPTCVTSHMETFKFGGYQDLAEEHAFVTYILGRGLVLKKMTIHSELSMDVKKKRDILKGLSKISRGSTMCQLEFD